MVDHRRRNRRVLDAVLFRRLVSTRIALTPSAMTERRQMRLPRASGGVLFRFETRRGAESIFDDIGFHYGMIAKGNRRGASMTELELLESINIPEYFVTHVGQTECAGGGNVRIYNCVKRGQESVLA